tara:strand:+ start:8909 stop:9163 length:255 start_codon:yes stop_codon:yes gene_type:complete
MLRDKHPQELFDWCISCFIEIDSNLIEEYKRKLFLELVEKNPTAEILLDAFEIVQRANTYHSTFPLTKSQCMDKEEWVKTYLGR